MKSSRAVIDTVLTRPRFAFSPDEIEEVRAMFRSQGELSLPEVSAVVSADPGGTKFLHYTVAGAVVMGRVLRSGHARRAHRAPLWRSECKFLPGE